MEEKKKPNLKLIIIIASIIAVLIVAAVIELLSFGKKGDNYPLVSSNQGDYETKNLSSGTYYEMLTENTWKGEYHKDEFNTETKIDNTIKIISYKKYLNYIDNLNSMIDDKIEPYYTDKKCNYIILSYSNDCSYCNMDIIDCFKENNKVLIYGDETFSGEKATKNAYFITIPTNLPIWTKIEYRECSTTDEINNKQDIYINKQYRDLTEWPGGIEYKPIIYLYPTEDTEVSVKLLNSKLITHSYPKYTDGWKVLAHPNGDLLDLDTNKYLYSLYYESVNKIHFKVEDEGFVIKGEDTISFLEEKLAMLGLTERESEEFIVYWLPKLEENKYNYIRFATMDEINKNMPLEITPSPDTTIRVLMIFKGLESPIKVREQKLETPNRTGFVAVEWGGTELD